MQRAHVRNQNGSKSRQKGRKNSRFQWKEEWKYGVDDPADAVRELIRFQWKEEWKIGVILHLPSQKWFLWSFNEKKSESLRRGS